MAQSFPDIKSTFQFISVKSIGTRIERIERIKRIFADLIRAQKNPPIQFNQRFQRSN
jgi:hypothetical protein